jgi:hypothetical protein
MALARRLTARHGGVPGAAHLGGTGRAGNPAVDGAEIVLVIGREVRPERWLFVGEDGEVEEHRGSGGVDDERPRSKEPGLAQDDQQDTDVDRVADPPVRPGHHQPAGRVPGSWRAAADGREEPHAPPVEREPGGDQHQPRPPNGMGRVTAVPEDQVGDQHGDRPWHHDGEGQVPKQQAQVGKQCITSWLQAVGGPEGV